MLETTLGFSLAISLITIIALFAEAAKEAKQQEPVGVIVCMVFTLLIAALAVFQGLCLHAAIQ